MERWGKAVAFGGAVAALITAFVLGVHVGWKLNHWRQQKLRKERDYYWEKAQELHAKIES